MATIIQDVPDFTVVVPTRDRTRRLRGRADAERRGAVRSLGTGNVGDFDERLPRLQEWNLRLRLGLVTSFAYLQAILVRGEAVAGGISRSSEFLERGADLLLRKWREDGRLLGLVVRPRQVNLLERARIHPCRLVARGYGIDHPVLPARTRSTSSVTDR